MTLNNIFKSFSSFFNSNDENQIENDSNLIQGKELLNYEGMYKKIVVPHLIPLQMTSSPNLSSLIETLESDSSTNTKQTINNDKMSEIEKQFNQKITEYSTIYKSMIENFVKNVQEKGPVVKYYGKVVKDQEGNYVYVNNYGFTHRYISDTWSYNDKSCPNKVTNISKDNFNKLSMGPNMGSGQACKIAGQNVKNSTTNEIAWIDIKGFKHVYPTSVWNTKKQTCNLNSITLSAKAYDNIPNGTPMDNNTDCLKTNLDPILWSKLQSLNAELINLSSQLLNELSNVTSQDEAINQELNKKKEELNQYINQFKKNKINIDSIYNDYDDIEGQEVFTKSYAESNQYQKVIWFIFYLLILFGLFRSLDGADDTIASTILIIVLVFILFFVLKTTFK